VAQSAVHRAKGEAWSLFGTIFDEARPMPRMGPVARLRPCRKRGMVLVCAEESMSTVYTDITLKNSGDVINVGRGSVREKDVRSVTVNALVDIGAGTLAITESVLQKRGPFWQGGIVCTFAENGTKNEGMEDYEPFVQKWVDPVKLAE
jgi:hypothetical protein